MKDKLQVSLADCILAEKKILAAGFPFIKFELEAQLWRTSNGWHEQKCSEFIARFVGPELMSKVVYSRFYNDGSVDSELTITLPIMEAHNITKWMEAWNALSAAIGRKMDINNAGLHIAILTDPAGMYPCRTNHDREKIDNFRVEVTKLLPALLFMASHNYKTRRMYFRKPQIQNEKYSAINILRGGLEYRLFDTCYDKPEAVYEKIEVIAATLAFYSKRKNRVQLKNDIVMADGGEYQRLFENDELRQALDKSIKYLKPRHKTIEELKKERQLKLDEEYYRRSSLKKQAEADTKYFDAIALWEMKARIELRQFKVEIKDKKGWKSLESDDNKALEFLIERGWIPRKPNKEVIQQRVLSRAGGTVFRIRPLVRGN